MTWPKFRLDQKSLDQKSFAWQKVTGRKAIDLTKSHWTKSHLLDQKPPEERWLTRPKVPFWRLWCICDYDKFRPRFTAKMQLDFEMNPAALIEILNDNCDSWNNLLRLMLSWQQKKCNLIFKWAHLYFTQIHISKSIAPRGMKFGLSRASCWMVEWVWGSHLYSYRSLCKLPGDVIKTRANWMCGFPHLYLQL